MFLQICWFINPPWVFLREQFHIFYNIKNTSIISFFVISLDEVSSARSRLSGALNTAERIVDKYAGDDFPISPFKRFQRAIIRSS